MLKLRCPICGELLQEYNSVNEYYICECGFIYERKGFGGR